MQDIAAIIPARWGASRFPGKPLALLHGRPVVLHVWDRCREAGLGEVVIATDDDRIRDAALEAGARVAMTDPALPSGTDRCAQVAASLHHPWIINVQGDEPFISPRAIQAVGQLLQGPSRPPIATLARHEADPALLASPHLVKVVTNQKGMAMYFSRQWIPAQRDVPVSGWAVSWPYAVHLGIYGFSRECLLDLAGLAPTALERAEQLEQLRWLDHGYTIAVGMTDHQSIGIDTPEDLARASLLPPPIPLTGA